MSITEEEVSIEGTMVAAKVTLTVWVATEVKTKVAEEAVVGESELWADMVAVMVAAMAKLAIVLLFFLPKCPASDRSWQREHLCMKLWQLV